MTLSRLSAVDGTPSVAKLTPQELANLALQAHQDARRMNDAAMLAEALRLATLSREAVQKQDRPVQI